MTDSEGYAISFRLLERGTPVFTSDGVEIGTVDRVLQNEREDIFDGIVIRTGEGERFVDAPEIGRIERRRVETTIDSAAAAALPPPDEGAPVFVADPSGGKVKRFFGGGWKRR